ncbi:phospholipase D-like domain-containing protein [Ramlibacter rhizophilus]|nr:phospholipase D-like domain-containing protein [Ramlibacter rhizophilus]
MSWPLRIGVALGAAVVPAVMLWSARRHRSPVLDLPHDAPIGQLLPSLAGIGLGTPIVGNDAEVLENGAFFDALLERIGRARRSVHLETFLWEHGELSDRVTEALCERARAGVEVRVLLDSAGARWLGHIVPRRLRESRCELAYFHRAAIRNLGVLSDRDHRKIVVVDGEEAFVGGHCITDRWLGDAEDGRHYADVSLRLRGPIVHNVQAAFCENWCASTRTILVGEHIFPHLAPAGPLRMHAMYAKPSGSAPAVKVVHHAALCLARERIWIQNPYFIPKAEAIDALARAVARGVDVRVLMPSSGSTDKEFVQHAAHRNFQQLLSIGVRLFEYPHTLLHQKIMTIDRQWFAIGSSNFDDRSFDTNDEIMIGVMDAALTARMDGIFEKYAARAREIRLGAWERRGLLHKLQDRAVYQFNEVL